MPMLSQRIVAQLDIVIHRLSELERRLIKIENKIDNIDGRWKGDKNE